MRAVSPPIYSVGFIYKGTIKMNIEYPSKPWRRRTKIHHNQFNILTLFFLSFMNFMVKNQCKQRNQRLNISINLCALVVPMAVSPRFPSETQTKIKKMKNKPNFRNSISTLTREMKGAYPNLHPPTHYKSKPNPKPIQTQSKPNSKILRSPCSSKLHSSEIEWRRRKPK